MLSQFGFMDGIVRTRTFFEENNTAYLVMDYIEGDSVKKYVTENGRVTPGGLPEDYETADACTDENA